MKKIAVRVPQWLGDAVVSTVFIKRLKAREPQAQISVLCVSPLAAIFETHPDVRSVLKLPYPDGNVFSVGRAIAKENFDEAYILPRSYRTAFECFLAKVPIRIGYTGDLRGPFLTRPFLYDSKQHYVHRYLTLLGEETFPLDKVEPYFPSVKPAVEPVLKRPVLGLAPVSIAPSRTWMPERFVEVANRFQQTRGGTVVLFGSSAERNAIEKIKAGIKGTVIDTAGGLKLPELGWMMSQCDLLLANDSGLMHVASALKTPTVVLFGASDPTHALPPWGKFISIQHAEIFCVPCLRNYCVRFGEGHNACLKAIHPEEVLTAIQQM